MTYIQISLTSPSNNGWYHGHDRDYTHSNFNIYDPFENILFELQSSDLKEMERKILSQSWSSFILSGWLLTYRSLRIQPRFSLKFQSLMRKNYSVIFCWMEKSAEVEELKGVILKMTIFILASNGFYSLILVEWQEVFSGTKGRIHCL